ncbi:hypothetical protein DJ017_18240 [Phenylobacterium soli]|uniref:Uncharacterized protein n=2 Tax=Phenylobacterium soli TaxID=2170551 RepID=A0A328AB20_9CAUL|nr:hypothetical protein DJ017_18240 [Phenylobacterium soli]
MGAMMRRSKVGILSRTFWRVMCALSGRGGPLEPTMQADTPERPQNQPDATVKDSRQRKRYRLSELVAQMNDDRRGEIQVGPALGREFGA